MNAQATPISTQGAAPRLAEGRNYPDLLARLGFAALLLVSAPALAQPLGAAQSFAILGGTSVTAGGTGSLINGDVGVSPGTSITGFPANATTVPPFVIHNNDQPAIDARAAFLTLNGALSSGACIALPSDQLNGQSLGPGTYCGGALDLATGGTLTLTGAGVYIFRATSSLTTGVGSNISLLGADPCSVFWQVTSLATIDGATFAGNIVAQTGVHMNTAGSSLTGRALVAAAGDVTLAGTNSVGGCSGPAVPPPGGSGVSLPGKVFSPTPISAGGVSTLTITLSNTNLAVATLIAPLTDTLPSGIVIAPTPNASTTCGSGGLGGGVVSATAGGSTVSLSTTSTIPAGGTCTVTVDVTALVASGTFVNTLAAGALQTTFGTNIAPASGALAVRAIAVPTLSEWAMILLALLLAIGGVAAMRRRAR